MFGIGKTNWVPIKDPGEHIHAGLIPRADLEIGVPQRSVNWREIRKNAVLKIGAPGKSTAQSGANPLRGKPKIQSTKHEFQSTTPEASATMRAAATQANNNETTCNLSPAPTGAIRESPLQ